MNDPKLDQSLRSIAAIGWPGSERNRTLEEKLMNVSQSPSRPRRGLWLAAGAVLVSSAVFGAAKAYDYFVVHVNVNGVEHTRIIQRNADGTALVEVPVPGGGTSRILVGPENIGPDGSIHAAIRITPGNEPAKPAPK